MEYETRPGSREYLADPVDEARAEENIDFFHIYQALQTIEELVPKPRRAGQHPGGDRLLHRAVQAGVRDLVRGAERASTRRRSSPASTWAGSRSPTPSWSRHCCCRAASAELGGSSRAQEIAAHWDSIERDLRNPDLWAFVTAESEPRPTHISLLLDTLAANPADLRGPRQQFYTFETLRHEITQPGSKFWDRVVDLHSLSSAGTRTATSTTRSATWWRPGTASPTSSPRPGARPRAEFDAELDASDPRGPRADSPDVGRPQLQRRDSAEGQVRDLLLLMNVEATRTMQ